VSQASLKPLGLEYHPFQPDQLANPYPLYELLRKHDPVTFSPEVGAWLVTRYRDVRFALSQPAVFSSRDVKNPNLCRAALEILQQGYPMLPVAIDSDGLDHQRFRQPHQTSLASARMTPYDDFVRALTNRLVDNFIDDGHAEFISQFAYPLPLEVILHMLGIPRERLGAAKQWCEDLVALLYGSLSEEQQVECAKTVVTFQHYIAEIITEQRKSPQDDMVGIHITSQIPGADPLSFDELIAFVCGFIMAGHRTTVDSLGNALALLLQPNSRWKALVEHPELIRSAIEEVLRYDAPVAALFRTTTREIQLGDVSLPEGARVLLMFGSANRDEAQFPSADQFDMQRQPNLHVGFGYGAHFCSGAGLARKEMLVALKVLTQRIPNIRLKPDQQFVHFPSIAFRGYQRLEVEW
jgi:cytochrome P450